VPLARWKDLCLDATDMAVAARFWSGVLGLSPEVPRETVTCLAGDTPERTTWVNQVPERKTAKNRVHLDLVLSSVNPLVSAGATVLHEPSPGWEWHVLADPEGNELCVFGLEPRDWATALVVDSGDPVRVAAWWADVLGATLSAGSDGRKRWLRGVPGLPFDVWKFVEVPEPKTVKNRWHWDLVSDDVDALVAKGATVQRRPDDDISWHVLADPEGNEFCTFGSG
jgi:hypothetical protein